MEVLKECLTFSREGATTHQQVKWRCQLLLVNFKKLLHDSSSEEQTYEVCKHDVGDILHAVSGVCSMSLPDMEISAIYSTLTSPDCTTAVIMASKQSVFSHRTLEGHPKPLSRSKIGTTKGPEKQEEDKDAEEENPFASIISDGEGSAGEEGEEDEDVDPFVEGRLKFLDEAAKRKSLIDQFNEASVGAEHCVLGCAAFSRLSGPPAVNAVQLSLLAVRRSCRNMGIGRYLMQCCKDPEVVGHYNALVVFADPKAEDFFARHSFSEDPILTARYRPIVDNWENSTLMVYTPPFSGAGLAVGSLQTLTHFQEFYKQWRDSAITGYSTQLGVMERLRHELLLLHSKVQSQDELISSLSVELKQVKEDKNLLEQEFLQYRRRSQQLLCKTAAEGAEKWINNP